ncbi:uncharacterized protein LOC142177987 [Nicotiana tabacum]|uniref:Uncharacterized protein LOC142177987 n=1 Tax=Nicotiana tabacum TaxID=4097 RepID=A0AC58U1L7_TOBAC
MKHVPSVNQAYAMLMSEESQRNVAGSAGILGAAPNATSGHYESTTLYSSKSDNRPKHRKNFNLYCDFCKLKGHSKENCYKIVGYPADYKFKKKGGAGVYNAVAEYGLTSGNYNAPPELSPYTQPCGQQNPSFEMTTMQPRSVQPLQHSSHTANMEQQPQHGGGSAFPFTKEQYDQIMQILNSNTVSPTSANNNSPSPTSQANAIGTNIALLDFNSPQEWIIDIGETNHMVSNVNLLDKATVIAPPIPRKVLLPNGDVTQELFNGRVKEIGRERDGLCFLQQHGNKMLTVVSLEVVTSKADLSINPNDIVLWHRRLGHVSIIVLKRLFTVKLASITNAINNCCVRPCAKVTRTPFPHSSIKSTSVFDLIHVDVWGPYKTENVFPFKDSLHVSPPIFNSLPSPPSCEEVYTDICPSPHINPSTSSSSGPEPLSIAPEPCPTLRRLLRTKHPPLWLKDFVTQPSTTTTPYSITNYVSYDSLSPSYQSYIVAFSSIVEPLLMMRLFKTQVKKTKATLQKIFKVKDLGELKYFLGIEFARSSHGILMHQRKYGLEFVSELGLGVAKPAATPLEANVKLTTPQYDEHIGTTNTLDDALLPDITSYQRLLGKLLYLTVTRPDIAFSVQTLSQFMQKPKKSHIEAALRVVKYFKNHPGQGVLLSSQKRSVISVFCDADWAACPLTRKSVSGFFIKYGDSLNHGNQRRKALSLEALQSQSTEVLKQQWLN